MVRVFRAVLNLFTLPRPSGSWYCVLHLVSVCGSNSNNICSHLPYTWKISKSFVFFLPILPQ